jgi:hypothetical protein
VKAARKEEREKGRARAGTQVEEDESTDTESEVEEVEEKLQAGEEHDSVEGKKAGNLAKEGKQGGEDEKTEASVTFARRKVASNAWRYEEEELELPGGMFRWSEIPPSVVT